MTHFKFHIKYSIRKITNLNSKMIQDSHRTDFSLYLGSCIIHIQVLDYISHVHAHTHSHHLFT